MMYIKIHIFKVVKFDSEIEIHFWGHGEVEGGDGVNLKT